MEKRRTYEFKDEVDRLYDIADELDNISDDFSLIEAKINTMAKDQQDNLNTAISRLKELVKNSNEYDLKHELKLLLRGLKDLSLPEQYKACYSSTRIMASWIRKQKDYLRGRTTFGNYNVYENGIIYHRDCQLRLPAQQQRLLAIFLQAKGHVLNAKEIEEALNIEGDNISEAVRKLKSCLQEQCKLNPQKIIIGRSKNPRLYVLDVNL